MSYLGRRNKVVAVTSPGEEAEAFTYLEFEPPHPNDVDAIKYQDKDHIYWSNHVNTAINDPVVGQVEVQSYSRVSLDNEFRTYALLRRLNPNCSPSFHNYGKNPPFRVLDLGCGKGCWVMNAAKSWKNTKVTGLDLIDVYNMCGKEPHCPESPSEEVHNVEWDRSNFVKHPLPYAEDSFDLVRIANLSLCIPRQRWEFVFSEVWRILAPGGRLELIDDDLEFPAIAPPPSSAPRLQKSLNRHCVIIGAAFEEVEAVSEYEENVGTCKDLETIFNNMIVEKYDLLLRPHEHFDGLLRSRFGEGVKKLHGITLAIPSEAFIERADTARPPARRKNSEPIQFQFTHGFYVGQKRYKRTAAAVGGSDTRIPLELQTSIQQNDDPDCTSRASSTTIATPPQPRLVPQKLGQEDEIPEELYLLESVGKANGTKQPHEQDNTVILSDHLYLVWEDQHTNLLGLGIDEE
ncbi:predicted protein [Postia placenta Mad-698-R]|nr:predicted protein [Postia placenta Mad-698-R]